MNESGSARIRFGPYDADLTAGELRKNGQPVRIQEQPFQVLVALLDRPGEVVTREELRQRLWPTDSFGDFDQGLNTAINKLREALGDSAANPRFIETLPKRGYRFTHPIDLEPVKSTVAAAIDSQRSGNPKAFLGIAGIVALAVAVFVALWIGRKAPEPQLPLRRFAIRTPIANISTLDSQLVAVSPNGKHIAIILGEGKTKLWIQDRDQQQPRVVEGSEGALGPFWSPDSTMIGFCTAARVKKVSAKGGPVIQICDMPDGTYVSGGSWSPDGRSIVFTAGSPTALYVAPAAGGKASLLVSPQMLQERPGDAAGWISQPHFLPADNGVQALLFAYIASNPSVMMWDMNSGKHHLIGTGRDPLYSSTGHLLFQSGTDLWGQRFSLKQVRLQGEAFRVASNANDASVASDGTLVYRDAATEQLVWLDRRGARVGTLGQPTNGIYYPALSPDGHRVATETLENGNQDIWVSDVVQTTRIRLSSHPALEVLPMWSPAGDEIAFSSYRTGNSDIFVRRADAGSEEKPYAFTPQNERVSDWSRDGQYILYSRLHPQNGHDLWYLKRDSAGKWEPHSLLQTSFNEKVPKLSSDGRYVAYLSDESGRDEVYVREFVLGGRKWPVSSRGASQVRWSRNGRELFYVEAGTLIAASVSTTPEFSLGATTRLFSHTAFSSWIDPNYDVSADGQRFLLPERVGVQEPAIRVVQNWFAEFRERQ